jgi:anti-sigma factor RsiW
MRKKCLHPYKAYKYVLGALSKDERRYYDRHINTCDSCAELVSNVRKMPQSKLEARVDMITRELNEEREFERERRMKGCPSIEEMMTYAHGRLYGRKRKYIENHIKRCQECKENLKIIEKMEREFEEKD